MTNPVNHEYNPTGGGWCVHRILHVDLVHGGGA